MFAEDINVAMADGGLTCDPRTVISITLGDHVIETWGLKFKRWPSDDTEITELGGVLSVPILSALKKNP